MRMFFPQDYGQDRGTYTVERALGSNRTREELVGVKGLPERCQSLRAALESLGRKLGHRYEMLYVTGVKRIRKGKMIVASVNRWVLWSHDHVYHRNSPRADDLLYRELTVCDPWGYRLYPGRFVTDYMLCSRLWLALGTVGSGIKAPPSIVNELLTDDTATEAMDDAAVTEQINRGETTMEETISNLRGQL